MIDEEAGLVLRSRQGDRSAFEQLVQRTARLVFVRVYTKVHDRAKAEDLTQETFLTAWKKVGQVTAAKGFRAWLLSVAQSVVVDSIRRDSRKKRSWPRLATTELDDVAGGGPPPSDLAERAEAGRRAMSMLSELPEEYRLPLMLRYIGGADYATIARQLALSDGSLRGLLHRGLEMLRERMGEKV